MERDTFPAEVAAQLRWYVYRLIDPRNGETFYVGKGRGDRVFQHAKRPSTLAMDRDEDATDLKLQRIKDIAAAGLEVVHVIHRHNIDTEDMALQIEAAVIDAYPGLTVGGHGAGDFGAQHASEIIAEYAAKQFQPMEPLILISITKSYDDESRNLDDKVRGVWKIDVSRTKKFKLVLAHRRGLVLGAFRPHEWLPATKANFPWLEWDVQGRHGFVGAPAEPEVAGLYVGKRVPDVYRAKGAANPVRFVTPL